MYGATVITWLVAIVTLSGVWSEDVQVTNQCDANVALTCGDARSRFRMQFCQPHMDGLKKIVDVQLKTGLPHRFCRRQNNNMYGVGKNKTDIWVSNFCYGTFDVCIELELRVVTTEHDAGVGTTAATNEQTNADEAAAHISTEASNNLDANDSTTVSANTLVDASSTATETQPDTENDNNDNSTAVTVTQGAHKINADTETEMDPALKIILMAGISAGGLVLVLMICVAAYMAYSCKRKPAKEMYDQSSASKYRPKLSTAALVSSDLLNEHTNGLYDFIPCDRTLSNTIKFQRTFSVSDRPENNSNTDRNVSNQEELQTDGNHAEKHEYFTLAKEEACEHCAPKLQHNMDSNIAYSHTQEVLQHRRTSDTSCRSHTHDAHARSSQSHSCHTVISDGRKSRCDNCETESVYDRLMSVPRASVSDGAEYHHLGTFSRERKMTVDMSTQTEMDELK